MNQVDEYKSKCFSGLSKQVFGVLFYSIKIQGIKKICRGPVSVKNSIMQASTCLNKNDPVITKCYTTMIDGIMGAKNSNEKYKIPHMCWLVIEYNETSIF